MHIIYSTLVENYDVYFIHLIINCKSCTKLPLVTFIIYKILLSLAYIISYFAASKMLLTILLLNENV